MIYLMIEVCILEKQKLENYKVKQHMLLNLGAHYDLVPEEDLSILAQRVDNIITGQLSLLPLSKTLETGAQRIANLIIKKHAIPLVVDNNKQSYGYEHVYVSSIENTDVKTIRIEHLA